MEHEPSRQHPLAVPLTDWLSAPASVAPPMALAALVALDPEAFAVLRHFVRGSPSRAAIAARTLIEALALPESGSAPQSTPSPADTPGNTPTSPDATNPVDTTLSPPATPWPAWPDPAPPAALHDALRQAEMRVLDHDELVETLARLSPWALLGAHTRGSALARVIDDGLGALSQAIERLPELRRLADVLGRIERQRGPRNAEPRAGRNRVEGVAFGSDIADVLTSEWSLLADPETEPLFDVRFVERQLFQFEWSGGEPGAVSSPQRATPRGPLILCVDTSASMTGAPLVVARAAALALLRRALGEGRRVHALLFGGRNAWTSMDFLPGRGDRDAWFRFLSASFGGGTDYAGPLRHALRLRTTDPGLALADVALVSDGIAVLPPDVVGALAKARADGMRLGAIAVLRDGCHAGILAELADPLEKLETGAFSV